MRTMRFHSNGQSRIRYDSRKKWRENCTMADSEVQFCAYNRREFDTNTKSNDPSLAFFSVIILVFVFFKIHISFLRMKVFQDSENNRLDLVIRLVKSDFVAMFEDKLF